MVFHHTLKPLSLKFSKIIFGGKMSEDIESLPL